MNFYKIVGHLKPPQGKMDASHVSEFDSVAAFEFDPSFVYPEVKLLLCIGR